MSKKLASLPTHVGIIMDGNRRWAKQHGFEVLKGHEYAANKVIQPLVEHCIARGVKYLTLWAFSTENWRRDPQEVAGLMGIFRDGLRRNGEELHKKGVRLQTIGDLSRFPKDIQVGLQNWKEKTAENTNITVIFALNYGGREDILRAVKKWSAEKTELTEESFSNYLDTAGIPDPDLIIRPGGEQRVSGFMSWQAVYAELYFTQILMPDFGSAQLDEALEEFANRSRRFGS